MQQGSFYHQGTFQARQNQVWLGHQDLEAHHVPEEDILREQKSQFEDEERQEL